MHTYSVNNDEERSWHESYSFILTQDVEVDWDSFICIVDEEYLLISTDNGLYKFTCAGEYLDRCHDLSLPVIYGTDRNDQVLVAEFENGAIYLFKPLSEKEIQKSAILPDVQTTGTRSMVIDRNNNVWVLSSNDEYKLSKFLLQQ